MQERNGEGEINVFALRFSLFLIHVTELNRWISQYAVDQGVCAAQVELNSREEAFDRGGLHLSGLKTVNHKAQMVGILTGKLAIERVEQNKVK